MQNRYDYEKLWRPGRRIIASCRVKNCERATCFSLAVQYRRGVAPDGIRRTQGGPFVGLVVRSAVFIRGSEVSATRSVNIYPERPFAKALCFLWHIPWLCHVPLQLLRTHDTRFLDRSFCWPTVCGTTRTWWWTSCLASRRERRGLRSGLACSTSPSWVLARYPSVYLPTDRLPLGVQYREHMCYKSRIGPEVYGKKHNEFGKNPFPGVSAHTMSFHVFLDCTYGRGLAQADVACILSRC